ncbi:MAG: hypothetical protein SGILL_000245 [Bacillariaceae sp.]
MSIGSMRQSWVALLFLTLILGDASFSRAQILEQALTQPPVSQSDAQPQETSSNATLSPSSEETTEQQETLGDIVEETGVLSSNNATWNWVVHPAEVCGIDVTYCIPVSKFRDLPGIGEDPALFNQTYWETVENAYVEKIIDLHLFTPGLALAIAEGLFHHWDDFQEAKSISVTMEGKDIDVTMLSIGAVIRDIQDIDYIGGYFTVDLRLYVKRVMPGTAFDSLQQAINASWTDLEDSHLVARNYGEPPGKEKWARLLPEDNSDNPNQLMKHEVLMQDGSCNAKALTKARLLNFNEYTAMSGANSALVDAITGGLSVLRGNKRPTPVTDANDNILYFNANGVRIKFQPLNPYFYPFQLNVLDINVASPATDIALNHKVQQYSFCIDPSMTGFKHPLPSLPQEGVVNMIPTVWRSSNAPWFNEDNDHMFLKGTGVQSEEEHVVEKFFQTAVFRIVYQGAPIEPWFDLLPILFTAFTVQLQWMVTRTDNCGGSTMITAVLLIQNLVNMQAGFVGYSNIMSQALSFTYIVAIIYVVAVALMTFTNIAKQNGNIEFLAKQQENIFRYFRLVGNIMSIFYIPLLVFSEDTNTGEQNQYKWLWPVCITVSTLIFAGVVFRDAWRLWNKKKDEKERVVPRYSSIQGRAITLLTVDEVKDFITGSDLLEQAVSPYLSHDDLTSIAHQLHDAEIDGNALVVAATDPKFLVSAVGLSVGKAINFSKGFDELVNNGSIVVRSNVLDKTFDSYEDPSKIVAPKAEAPIAEP